MFAWWGRAVVRLRWWVLALGLAVAVLGATWGGGVFDRVVSGGFFVKDSEAARAGDAITAAFGEQGSHVVVLYRDPLATVQQPTFRQPVTEAVARVRALPGVREVRSAFDAPPGTPAAAALAARYIARDQHATLVTIQLTAGDDDGRLAAYERVAAAARAPGLRTDVGGGVGFQAQVKERSSADLTRAELFSAPVLLLMLLLIFRGLIAATTPLIIGALAVLGSFIMVRVVTMFADVSVFAINVITLLGLGMAVDYALFVVSRFREELADGYDVPAAIARTVGTAGRTVLVSGLTIALALASLLIFPQFFLRSMGLGAMSAVLVAMLGALTVLPALLAVLGHRVNALRLPLPRRRRPVGPTGAAAGAWARIAHSVMRRPVLYAVGVAAVLLALAVPAYRMTWGGFDERILPAGTEARTVSEVARREFPDGGADRIQVFVRGVPAAAVPGLAATLGAVPPAAGAEVVTQRGDAALVAVRYPGEATDARTQDLVRDLRAVPAPAGAEVLVGGRTANDVDVLDGLRDRLPWMAVLMAASTYVLLFFAFGSLLLPLKAVLMNLISIGASYGVMVWGFQDGHLAGLLHFTSTGFLDPTNLIIMLAVLFGLATDYEVFLLSRVREEWEATGDNTRAVALGLQHTGRIITAAALLLILVVAGFAAGSITMIKMVGVGVIVAIVLDATLVRLLLVPATMRLLGRWNWWAPRPLARLYRRFGLRESAAAQRYDAWTPADRG
ncbi:hypothetical protein GCM10010123_03650 [Pilimelia anulata]|uniref:SSD domain-containing protein n=1 Tax=Pilimelia anulata TaxID=53371 RepID=A0A8J3F8A6_9ACTN|nr:MMPL family transporter [Pilimelia anulata]GGJ76913.1 hypothetical protein GCM10010123_03650 [Pilimelia anulata]